MSSGKRYKFQGSTFGVQTSLGTPKTISAISLADPAIVSASAHGFDVGDVVKLENIDGMTQVDDGLFAVDTPVAAGTFALSGVDSTLYDALVVGSPAPTASPVVFSNFCELTGSNQQDGATDQEDVSTICSTAKEFEDGLPDSGTLQLDFNWAGNLAVQAAMRTARANGTKIAFKVTFPGDGGVVIMIGSVQQTSFSGQVGQVWKGSATIKLSGDIYVQAAA